MKEQRLPTEQLIAKKQNPFTENEEEKNKSILREFAVRFLRIFNSKPADIARTLETSETVVGNYVKGKRFPAPAMLVKLHEKTGVSLDWLILGKEKTAFDLTAVFTPEELAELETIAAEDNCSVTQVIRRFALVGKAAVDEYKK